MTKNAGPVKAGLMTNDLNGDLALYDGDRDSVHVLNPTARLIFEMHAAGGREEEIEAAVRDRFEAGADADVAGDIRRLLEKLKAKGVIVARKASR